MPGSSSKSPTRSQWLDSNDANPPHLPCVCFALGQIDASVDVGRLPPVPALHHEVVVLARAVDEDIHLATHEFTVSLPRDPALNGHQLACAIGDDQRGTLSGSSWAAQDSSSE